MEVRGLFCTLDSRENVIFNDIFTTGRVIASFVAWLPQGARYEPRLAPAASRAGAHLARRVGLYGTT